MLIPIFKQSRESGPKHYSCQLCLDWHEIDIVKRTAPTFWYNCTNDSKGDKFGTNEVGIILYRIKWKLLCLWQNFDMPVSHIHTFLLIKAGQCATKNFKR